MALKHRQPLLQQSLCLAKASSQVLKALLEAHPEAAKEKHPIEAGTSHIDPRAADNEPPPLCSHQ